MDNHSLENQKGHGGETHGQGNLVQISIDGRHEMLPKGRYLVSDLKQKLGVPADYELDRVEHSEFIPLADTDYIEIHEKELFVSHVRRGGAS
jgi:hypothetical protein